MCETNNGLEIPYIRVDLHLNIYGELGNPAPTTSKLIEGGVSGIIVYCEDYGTYHAYDRTCTQWPDHTKQVAEDAEFGGNSDFHDRMATLGLGRGGADELLVLAWRQPSDRSQARLQARATRRPGHLELALTASRAVQYAMPEAFVPLWPLAQLVTVAP